MKEITVTIDADDLKEVLAEHFNRMFPGMTIQRMPYVSDLTIRLRREDPELSAPMRPEPFIPPAMPPQAGPEEPF